MKNIVAIFACSLLCAILLRLPDKITHTPAPVVVSVGPAPGAPFQKDGLDGTPRHGYYRIHSSLTSWNYTAWKYSLNEDRSITFVNMDNRKTITLSPPFTITQEYAAAGWKPRY